MDNGQNALLFFYGIFWASAFTTAGRYRAYDTHSIYSQQKGRYAKRRFLVALLVTNLLPVIWLWFLYNHIVLNIHGIIAILLAAIASLSVFAFNRILHAIIATNYHSSFYARTEWQEMTKIWGKRFDPATFQSHFMPGVCYLLFFPGISFLLGRLFGLH